MRLSERTRDASWATTVLACLSFTFYTASVHRTGLHWGGIDLALVWYYAHGPQDALWVPYVHPPLYSIFMNTLEALKGWTGLHPMDQVLLAATGVQLVLTVLAAGLRGRLGRAGSALAAVLITLTPSSMRPLEQYPVAALLVTITALLLVRATRAPEVDGAAPRHRRLLGAAAAFFAFASVEMSLLLWFPLGALAVHLFVTRRHARRGLLLGASVVVVAFFATTFLGFWEVLADTRGETPTIHGISIGWSNPLLFAVVAVALVPGVRRRAPAAAPLAVAVLGFAACVVLLQKLQYADGAPYPSSYRYFSMIDPLLALGVAAVARGAWLAAESRWAGLAVTVAALLVVASQAAAYVDGERHLWLPQSGFLDYARPWRTPSTPRLSLDPSDSIDISGLSDARKDCVRSRCSWQFQFLEAEGRGLLTGESDSLDAMRACLARSCPDD